MTHFLDISGKIADLEAILHEYESELENAERRNDTTEIRRLPVLSRGKSLVLTMPYS